jgi:zinc protease
MTVAPPEDFSAAGSLLGEKPGPGAIVLETADDEAGTVQWKLGNGATVILKNTQNKNNEVVLYAVAKGGVTGADDYASAMLAPELLEASGLGPYSRTELVRLLTGKQVSLGAWAYSFTRGIRGTSTVNDLPTLFELLYLTFTQPKIDLEAAQVVLDQYRTDLAQSKDNPQRVFFDEVQRLLSCGNPWFAPITTETLAGVSADKALAFLRKSLNPGDYTFVFTGNLDLPSLRELCENYIASIPPGQSFREINERGLSRPAETEQVIRKGREEQSLVYLSWFAPLQYSEKDAASFSAMEEYLDILLTEKIREALGGVYSISVSGALNYIPRGEASLGIFFLCDPGRVEELTAAVKAELEKLKNGSIDVEILEKAKLALAMTHSQSLESNLFLARRYAAFSVFLGLPASTLNNVPSLYKALSAQDLRRAAALVLAKGPAQCVLYPEGFSTSAAP